MKRATNARILITDIRVISIHALMKRATEYLLSIGIKSIDFNPRPHEEGDVSLPVHKGVKVHFNPRPHEEGDVLIIV